MTLHGTFWRVLDGRQQLNNTYVVGTPTWGIIYSNGKSDPFTRRLLHMILDSMREPLDFLQIMECHINHDFERGTFA